jgi:hypothetical protein
MAHANHSSSSRSRLGLWGVMLALAGCVGQSNLLEGLRLTAQAESREIVDAPQPQLKPTLSVDAGKSDIAVKSDAKKAIVIPAGVEVERRPAWCEYLSEDMAAQTTIIRSPTLKASLDDGAKANVSLGLSVTDFAKARVMEESAEAQCRRYVAQSGLQKLVFLSPQGLTSAGYRAKSDAILKRKKDIQALRRTVSQAMADGDIDREKATMLMGLADQLLSEAAQAKSQADRRTGDFLGSKDQASLLGRELMRAEADLEDLNSRMRTFDAVDVSISAGWNDDLSNRNFAAFDDSLSGKVSLSVKLGALAPSRFEHEERAKQAKLRAIAEEGGPLWQINVLRLAHERAIQGLEESRGKIDNAIAEVNRLSGALADVKSPEFQATAINARFRMIQLKSDKAAVEGSLAEIRSNLKRLKTTG